mgnify:FL=1
MKKAILDFIFLALLTILVAWSMHSGVSGYLQTPIDKGVITVYGSKTCPWCVKQEKYLTEKGIAYNFVDCKQQQCPDFVQGFPTLDVNGEIKSGYTEI